MLCQFSVRNYKSIRDEITLDLQAASISEHEDSVIVDRDNERFLPVSVLYGPNGRWKNDRTASIVYPLLYGAAASLCNDRAGKQR